MSLNPPLTKGKFGGPQKAWKLSEQDKMMVVSLHASGLTPHEVVERARTMNIEISHQMVWQYASAPKWQKLIDKIKKETYSDLAAVAGSHKRVRLDRAERIYEKSMSKNKFKDALAATEHQRKEMEGGGDFNLTMNQFNLLSDEELEAKKAEVMDRIARQPKGVIDVIPTNKTEATGA